MKKEAKRIQINIRIDETRKERFQKRAKELNKTLSVYLIDCAENEIKQAEKP